jgi:hypothetical protein
MFRLVVASAIAVLTTGCASSIGAFYNRPVVEDSVKDAISTLSLSADRRTVLVVTDPASKNRGKFCAEPPPDTATGLKTELEASLEAKKKSEALKAEIEGKAEFKDKLETNVVVIAERTPPLDAFRTGVYALCQFHLNGAVKDEEVRGLFEKLIAAFESAHKASAK